MGALGYEANLISTIVDAECFAHVSGRGYEANLISTIVDFIAAKMANHGYEANLISTIVDC